MKTSGIQIYVDHGHTCSKCPFEMSDAASETSETLHVEKKCLTNKTQMSLIHIARYLTLRDKSSGEKLFYIDRWYYK